MLRVPRASVEGRCSGVRAGAQALSLFSTPLIPRVLDAVRSESRPLRDLRRDVDLPSQTTVRGQLRLLTRTRVLERRQEAGFPGAVTYSLGPAGGDLLTVGRLLQAWLTRAPRGPVQLGSIEAKNVIKILVQAWSSWIVRALASGPVSLTDLNRLITQLSYPSLERRLGAMRAAGMVEPCPGQAHTIPYQASAWLRQAIAPLSAASRWERRHAPELTTPVGQLDIEASFLLTLPMLELPGGLSGSCRLTVEGRADNGRVVTVTARFSEGVMESCAIRLEGDVDAGISGAASAWIDAVETGDPHRLDASGDRDLVRAILQGLHDALCGTPADTASRNGESHLRSEDLPRLRRD